MNIVLSDMNLETVTRSWQLLQSNRRHLSVAMRYYLARWNSADATPMLFDMLLDHTSARTEGILTPEIAETARRHAFAGITSKNYAKFGDGLGAAMKDVLGGKSTPGMVAAWGDAYWAIVRALPASET